MSGDSTNHDFIPYAGICTHPLWYLLMQLTSNIAHHTSISRFSFCLFFPPTKNLPIVQLVTLKFPLDVSECVNVCMHGAPRWTDCRSSGVLTRIAVTKKMHFHEWKKKEEKEFMMQLSRSRWRRSGGRTRESLTLKPVCNVNDVFCYINTTFVTCCITSFLSSARQHR